MPQSLIVSMSILSQMPQVKQRISWPGLRLAQFTNVETIEHVWTLVRTEEHLIGIEDAVKKHGGVVLFSLADRIIRSKLEQICDRYNIPYVAVLDHAVHTFQTSWPAIRRYYGRAICYG